MITISTHDTLLNLPASNTLIFGIYIRKYFFVISLENTAVTGVYSQDGDTAVGASEQDYSPIPLAPIV